MTKKPAVRVLCTWKITESECVDKRIDIFAYVDWANLAIRISRNGSPLPEEQLNNLFEPYVSSRNRTTSMGMSIAARILRAHQGSITAQNNNPSGTTVSITLPLSSQG